LVHRFFLRAFPKGFARIRHFGLLTNRYRTVCLPLARKLLELDGRDPLPVAEPTATDTPLWHCPKCGGPMLVARRLTAAESAFKRNLDSS